MSIQEIQVELRRRGWEVHQDDHSTWAVQKRYRGRAITPAYSVDPLRQIWEYINRADHV